MQKELLLYGNSKMTDEIDVFLCTASQLNLSDDDILQLKKIAGQNPDWDMLSHKALRHGVASFIYYSLTKYELRTLLPIDIYNDFRSLYYTNAVRNTRFISELDKVAAIIMDEMILLKGIDFIRSLYPSIGIRSLGDIDILVKKENAVRIWKQVKKSGFKNAWIISKVYKSSLHQKISEDNGLIISKDSLLHLPPLIKNNSLAIEFHWNMFHLKSLYPVTISGWETAQQLKGNLYTLSNEMRLIHSCEHFYSHFKKCSILRSLCDVNEIIEANQNTLDWDYIKKQCIGSELEKAMEVTLTLCNKMLKTPVPEYFFKEQIFSGHRISLDFLIQGFVLPELQESELSAELLEKKQKKINAFNYHLDRIKHLQKPYQVVIYLYRIFVPNHKWIISNYKLKTNNRLWVLYFRYWSFMFSKYILRKKIQIGN